MSDKSDLKAELERKKQRLAQIREEKKRKEEERKKKEKTENVSEDSDLDRKRRETEALLQSIGISPEPPLVPTPMSPSSQSVSTTSDAGSQESVDGGTVGRRRMHRLGASKIVQIDFLPKELVTYTKETQTPSAAHQSEELTEEEREQILHSEDFLVFFERSVSVYPELMVASYNSNEDAPHEPDGIALVWNMKFKKTTAEYTFHCQHPVYCVNVVGTQNANNLITESMELVYNKSKPVAVTGMAFPAGDVNNYVVGSEEGMVYSASRHGSKAGIAEMFEGHQGPVTGISCHNAVGTVDFSHLFITSSFDWTVKLWSTKHNKPLYSFEDNADYVYDVSWSPVHPALFASVDGMGRLDLWNLNNDTEVPTASVTIEGACALNRVRWASGGREVAVGDSEGRVWIYDVGELAVPHPEDWSRFARTLVEIRANRGDGEEEGAVELAA
ncbi:unnamed protein product [Coregonus sp. 'balchen']|nr:unnamed protein product [Coregonus sp. 'balchen']